MSTNERIEVFYNRDLNLLEELLSKVQRPGDFFVEGSIEAPMPRIEVNQVGVLSFPVPESQVLKVIEQAVRAPYGRGEDTLFDESVRKVWQLSSTQFQVSGKAWSDIFSNILSQVKMGLGCMDMEVSSELYKMLIYDPGSFFLPHRDTEKSEGMFGTLVIILPSFHQGGQLIIRHSGREISLDLSSTEVSELRFAAFYADCEHEVRPTLDGYRICLVYNLIQTTVEADGNQTLVAPLYDEEIEAISEILHDKLKGIQSPKKIAWLLEHEYSPAGLSLSGLKNSDAAVAKVLKRAAEKVECAVHLAIVHIEESGSAGYGSYSDRWPRRRYYDDNVNDGHTSDASNDDFEVIEVMEIKRYVDSWKNISDQSVNFGKLPLAEDELLPEGALDQEKPDEQRFMEATGNEGASYERSYHRAALLLWPRERFAEVLFEAGFGAVVPFLKEQADAYAESSLDSEDKNKLVRLAKQIIEAWKKNIEHSWYDGRVNQNHRKEMLEALQALNDLPLLKEFIDEIVIHEFDGSESVQLGLTAKSLGAKTSAELYSRLMVRKMGVFPEACMELFRRMIASERVKLSKDWLESLKIVARAMIDAIPKIAVKLLPDEEWIWRRAHANGLVDPKMVSDFLDSLSTLNAFELRERAAVAITKNLHAFDPGEVLISVLETFRARKGHSVNEDDSLLILWQHSAEFLLERSEYPPQAPTDWALTVQFSCHCEDCRDLEAFARDPKIRTQRFRMREDRRSHLQHVIKEYTLDMDYETEHKGSPHTLICTKSRRSYERRCKQFRQDIAKVELLNQQMRENSPAFKVILSRLQEAVGRYNAWREEGMSS